MLTRALHILASRPLVYDLVQVMAGSRHCFNKLKMMLPDTAGKRVLDIGAGTGRGLSTQNCTTQYVGIDTDFSKLGRLQALHPSAVAIRADASALPMKADVFDVVICVFVLHHLDDEVLRAVLGEISRVCKGWMIVMDALDVPSRYISRLLWRYDFGAYPRRRGLLLEELGRVFEIERIEEFTILHRYLLCRCKTRPVNTPEGNPM